MVIPLSKFRNFGAKIKLRYSIGKEPQKDKNKGVAFPQKTVISCLLRVPVRAREKDRYIQVRGERENAARKQKNIVDLRTVF